MNNAALRAAYERTAAKFPGFIINRSVLRMEQPLASNQSTYKFQMKQGNVSTDGPSQVLLNDDDAFVIVGLSLGIVKHDLSVSPAQYGNFQLFTYPDPEYFVGAPAGAAFEYQSLLTIFNGTLQFNTASLLRIKPHDTSDYLMVPRAQVVPPVADVNDLLNPTLPEFGGRGDTSRSYIEMQPTPLVDGQQQNEFTLNLGAGDYTGIAGQYTSAGAATVESRNYLVLRVLGMLVAQGSVAAKQYTKEWGI